MGEEAAGAGEGECGAVVEVSEDGFEEFVGEAVEGGGGGLLVVVWSCMLRFLLAEDYGSLIVFEWRDKNPV